MPPSSSPSLLGSVLLRLLFANALVLGGLFIIWQLRAIPPFVADFVIYTPLIALFVCCLRDNYSPVYIFSVMLALCHGLAHVFFPFLDTNGVNGKISVFEDQTIHLLQSIFVCLLLWGKNGRRWPLYAHVFVSANVLNVVAGFLLWGHPLYHSAYVWWTLFPALASGLMFASSCFFQMPKEAAVLGLLIQGATSILTFFFFKVGFV